MSVPQVLSVVATVAKVAFILAPDLTDVLRDAVGALGDASDSGSVIDRSGPDLATLRGQGAPLAREPLLTMHSTPPCADYDQPHAERPRGQSE